MSPSKTLSTAVRVIKQLQHDPRTVALLFIIPSVLILILKYEFQAEPRVFDSLAPLLLGIFPLIMMFLITSITTLRERKSGTLDRLLTMPVSKLDFILGYAVAFFFIATIQAIITSIVVLGILKVPVMGGMFLAIGGAVSAGLLGTALGLLTSAFAATEFQAVQFMPAFLFPQLLMCGLFIDRSEMAKPLQWLSDVLPLTYIVDAMKQVIMYSGVTHDFITDVTIVLLVTVVSLSLASVTIRRQEKP
jgi:ABC-2 type transport system permease protein